MAVAAAGRNRVPGAAAVAAATSMKTFVHRISEVLNAITRGKEHRASDRSGEIAAQQALERVIDGTDGRIRLVKGYRRALLPAIRRALDYTAQLVDRIPGTIEITRNSFVSNQYVNAFFTNPKELEATFEQSSELADFLEHQESNGPGEGWALLCMQKQERTVLGLALQGDRVRRDVRQTTVSFFDQHIYSPAPSEAQLRRELKNCLFEGLVTNALSHITERRACRSKLETERSILHGRLRHAAGEEAAALRTQLQALERRLEDVGPATPRACMEEVKKVFMRPEAFIRINNISMKLDKTGVKLDQHAGQPCNDLELAEVEIERENPRVVVLTRFQPAVLQQLHG